MSRAFLLLVGLVTVLAGSWLWARWWVNSVELPQAAMAEPLAIPRPPPPLPLPVERPRAPVVMAPAPRAVTVDGGVIGTPAVTQLIPLQQAAPERPPQPAAPEPPEFLHLRRLRDPHNPRTRLPPPNSPRIQIEPYLRP